MLGERPLNFGRRDPHRQGDWTPRGPPRAHPSGHATATASCGHRFLAILAAQWVGGNVLTKFRAHSKSVTFESKIVAVVVHATFCCQHGPRYYVGKGNRGGKPRG